MDPAIDICPCTGSRLPCISREIYIYFFAEPSRLTLGFPDYNESFPEWKEILQLPVRQAKPGHFCPVFMLEWKCSVNGISLGPARVTEDFPVTSLGFGSSPMPLAETAIFPWQTSHPFPCTFSHPALSQNTHTHAHNRGGTVNTNTDNLKVFFFKKKVYFLFPFFLCKNKSRSWKIHVFIRLAVKYLVFILSPTAAEELIVPLSDVCHLSEGEDEKCNGNPRLTTRSELSFPVYSLYTSSVHQLGRILSFFFLRTKRKKKSQTFSVTKWQPDIPTQAA